MKIKSLDCLYSQNPVKACRLALRRTEGVDPDKRLEAIDKMLGTYGIEAIRGEWQNGFWCDIVAVYCNAGDTYSTTVIRVRGDYAYSPGRFFVGTVGDFVEANEKRFGFQ
jgi:hypothetical protein